jgi:PAS domain S-box-containing protein
MIENLVEENAKIKAQIQEATNFIKDIENGKLDSHYHNEEDNENQLATALLSMQNQLKKISEEEKNRNWATEGLAKFADILRETNEDTSHLGDRIIANLVKYMGANQGGIFVLNEDDPQGSFLELISCYAYNRKKFVQKRVEVGEGLVGQTFLEKATIYMTELPKGYTTITSGLGEATPGNLVLIPLKVNEIILGVIELASFDVMEKYKVDFLEKVGESIASALSSVRVSQKTEKLLRESQIQTEQLRSQEEEVRQNMEELSATQEEMQRILKEAQNKEQYLNDLINVSKDSIITIDRNYKLISFNRSFSSALAGSGINVEKGFDFLQLFPDEKEKLKQKALYERAFLGESFEDTSRYERNGFVSYFMSNFSPLYNEQMEIFAVACYSKDVTALKGAQNQAEELLAASKQQAEELQAQEEEMRQNMEELISTQEEMQRILKETQAKESYLQHFIDATSDAIISVDKDLNIVSFNNALKSFFGVLGKEVEKGQNITNYLNPENREAQIEVYRKTLQGESFELIKQYGDKTLDIRYSPIKSDDGEIIGVCCFTHELSDLQLSRSNTEKILNQFSKHE